MPRPFAVLSVLLALASAAVAAPTPDQLAWFERLSPEEAAGAQRAYEDFQRQEHWDQITRVAVTDFVRTPDVVYLNKVGVTPWTDPVRKGDAMKVWWVVEMPRHAPTPFDVQVVWEHEGKQIRLQTLSVDRPSPNYRLHDIYKPTRPGVWTVSVLIDGRMMAQNNFRVL